MKRPGETALVRVHRLTAVGTAVLGVAWMLRKPIWLAASWIGRRMKKRILAAAVLAGRTLIPPAQAQALPSPAQESPPAPARGSVVAHLGERAPRRGELTGRLTPADLRWLQQQHYRILVNELISAPYADSGRRVLAVPEGTPAEMGRAFSGLIEALQRGTYEGPREGTPVPARTGERTPRKGELDFDATADVTRFLVNRRALILVQTSTKTAYYERDRVPGRDVIAVPESTPEEERRQVLALVSALLEGRYEPPARIPPMLRVTPSTGR